MGSVMIVNTNTLYDVMFKAWGFTLVECIGDADLVCFTGGADVHPSLYGEIRHVETNASLQRDLDEWAIYVEALENGVPMVGICRGGQFLNVMNGGSLWQDVDGHREAQGHFMYDPVDDASFHVSSTHHQMMIAGDGATIIAWATESSYKECMEDNEVLRIENDQFDTEVVLYRNTNCLCYQPHPEFLGKDSECQEHFFKLLEVELEVSA